MRTTMLLLTLCILMVLGPISLAAACVTQITNNSTDDITPKISNNGDIVWVGQGSLSQEIYIYDATTRVTTQLTNNTSPDSSPQINANGDVVWVEYNNTEFDNNIMLYTKATKTIRRIDPPDNPLVLDFDSNPQINNKGQVVWQSYDGSNWEIMFYDGATVRTVTSNGLTNEAPMLNNNGDIVWMASVAGTGNPDIWLHDGATGTNIQITNTPVPENFPQINDTGDIVWSGWDGATMSSRDFEIYYYQRSTKLTIRLTNNTCNDMNPQINAKGQIAWVMACATNSDIFLDGKNISNSLNDVCCFQLNDNGWLTWAEDFGTTGTNHQIFVWDGTTLIRLTNDAYDNINPQINNSNIVVWQGNQGTGTDYEIMATICVNLCAGVICSDNNACTTDSCDPATGNCMFTPKNCDDGNLCTTDSCDAATGNCVFTPRICDDGLYCNGLETCDPATGNCLPGHNPCPPDVLCEEGITICECFGPKNVTIRGGGQRPTTTDLEIQTEFTVMNNGCIVDSTASTITVTPGTMLLINCKAGLGPMPSSATLDGVPFDPDMPKTLTVTGSHTLVLTNKGNGGSDVDRITIKVQ